MKPSVIIVACDMLLATGLKRLIQDAFSLSPRIIDAISKPMLLDDFDHIITTPDDFLANLSLLLPRKAQCIIFKGELYAIHFQKLSILLNQGILRLGQVCIALLRTSMQSAIYPLCIAETRRSRRYNRPPRNAPTPARGRRRQTRNRRAFAKCWYR